MATSTWTNGAASNDWSVAGNWDGGVPLATENVIFDGERSTADVTAGLDQSAVDIGSLIIHKNYTGKIGVDGSTPLQISADKIVQMGGQLFVKDGTGTIDHIYVEVDRRSDGATTTEIDGDTVTRLTCIKGNIKVLTGIGTIANLEVSYRNSQASDVNLEYQATGDTITNLYMNGGTVDVIGTVTSLFVEGGRYVHNQGAGGAVASMYITDGNVIYNDAATITLAVVMGGVLDLSQDTREKTITTLRVFPKGKAIVPSDTVTITNGDNRRGAIVDVATAG
jgi:hypothetical protein